MSVKSYIPGTAARAERLLTKGLHGLKAGDGFAVTEWEDGNISLRPVEVDTELGALRDLREEGRVYFLRGRGAEPKSFLGVPCWNVAAGGAGVVSTEAALIADREEHGEVFEGADALTAAERLKAQAHQVRAGREGRDPDDLPGEAAGASADVEAGDDQAVATDGGNGQHVALEHGTPALWNLNPPRGYDGEAFSIALPLDYAPNPVDQTDVQQAITQAKQAAQDTEAKLMWLLVGAAIVATMWIVMTVLPWLLQQIGGESVSVMVRAVSLVVSLAAQVVAVGFPGVV